jgi:hypothetical protein
MVLRLKEREKEMDYPNMSYCMCQNTRLALKQIVSTIQEDFDGNVNEFFESLSRDEQWAFKAILGLAELMSELSEDAVDLADSCYED